MSNRTSHSARRATLGLAADQVRDARDFDVGKADAAAGAAKRLLVDIRDLTPAIAARAAEFETERRMPSAKRSNSKLWPTPSSFSGQPRRTTTISSLATTRFTRRRTRCGLAKRTSRRSRSASFRKAVFKGLPALLIRLDQRAGQGGRRAGPEDVGDHAGRNPEARALPQYRRLHSKSCPARNIETCRTNRPGYWYCEP
jgi:hypothetical protein